jgi:hypothetical protein
LQEVIACYKYPKLQLPNIDLKLEHLEEKESMRAFGVLFDYIQGYPRHAYKYLVKLAQIHYPRQGAL